MFSRMTTLYILTGHAPVRRHLYILTGHAPVRRYLYIMDLFDGDPTCRFCRMETETV